VTAEREIVGFIKWVSDGFYVLQLPQVFTLGSAVVAAVALWQKILSDKKHYAMEIVRSWDAITVTT
jgi:hypothetical protein